MPESSLQECYVMLICWNCYNMLICHFCHVWCVHPMRLISTCILIYAMSSLHRCLPCIFVINVVTSTSMQTRLRNVADFSPCSAVILMPCKLDATERSMLILRYFSKDVLNIWLCSIHPFPWLQLWSSLACHLSALLLLQKCFLADSLHVIQFGQGCYSWSLHAMDLFLTLFVSKTCLLDDAMLILSCNDLWWVIQAC